MTGERVFMFVDEEELFSAMKDLDCLYCRIPVTASKHHLRKKHLRFAVYYKDSGIVELRPTAVLLESLRTDREDETKPGNKAACQKCGILFTTTSNLRRHERLQHGHDQQPILCIDAKNAIYVTPKYLHGPRVPIHIRKSFTSQVLLCELEECWDFMKAQAQSGNPGKECRHLVRTNHARHYVPPPPLCVNSLDEMGHKQLLSASEKLQCREMSSRACIRGVDCVYPIFWGERELSERCVFFSVYTDLEDKWCQFGRTRVSFDTESGGWRCLCKRKRSRCVHKCLSAWWLFQERPELLQNAPDVHAESADALEEAVMDAEDVV
ncbi:si:ch211-10d23.5 isoform X3 [Puntigrus tetrazona]|uniref:si:ch211-10d23.5 isoform X3 n=1 Tax=Puntigrus tetrazona TaxID=1606681 RepID=UPI001C894B14|nr:si:ch211-10d23.5 isoform X3 [Puntigrus tetrazona]